MADWGKEGPAVRRPAPDLVAPEIAYGCLVVYGPAYLALLRKIWIPNFVQILKTTKPEILEKMILCVYCRKSELAKVQTYFAPLRKTPRFQVKYFPMVKPPRSSNQYPEMNRMHQHCLNKASHQDAPVFFFFPDQVLSSNCINYAWDLLQKGIRLCQFPSLRVNMRPTVRLLENGIRRNARKIFQPRALACLALGNLHRLCTGLFWDNFAQEKFPCSPYALIHPISPQTLLIHGLHNYIFFARPKVILHHARSIDVDFIQDGFPDKRSVYMVEDSDAMMAFDLSDNKRLHPCEIPADNRKNRIQQILNNLNLFKKRHLQTCASPSIVHAKDLTVVEHREIRARSVLLAPFLYRALYKLEKARQRQQQLNLPPLHSEIVKRITIKPSDSEPASHHPDKAFYLQGTLGIAGFAAEGYSTNKLFRLLSESKSREKKIIYARMILTKYNEPSVYKQMILDRALDKYFSFVLGLVKTLACRFRFKTRNPLQVLFFFLPVSAHRVFLTRFRIHRFQDV